MKIFNKQVNAGEKLFFEVDGPILCHRAVMKFPVIVLRGVEDGPTLWLNGVVHGDELNGSYASWQLLKELDPKDVKGTIIATPISNLAAFAEKTKTSLIDELDMDTQFPGSSDGFVTQMMAKILYDEMKAHATHLISFHTISKLYHAEPYTVSKIVPGAKPEIIEQSLELAKVFGVEANCVVDLATATGELPGVTNGALDITCQRDGIVAFMGEIGHGGIRDDKMVNIGIVGIKNVLIHLNMIAGTKVKQSEKQYEITKRKFVRISKGGLLDLAVKPGDIVKKGDNLANMHYFGKDCEEYPAISDAYIIATRKYPTTNPGDRVAFLGLEWREI